MMTSINCTGKFCYRRGKFQKTEAATGDVLKIQIKVSQNHRKKLIKSCSENVWKHPGAHLHQNATFKLQVP